MTRLLSLVLALTLIFSSDGGGGGFCDGSPCWFQASGWPRLPPFSLPPSLLAVVEARIDPLWYWNSRLAALVVRRSDCLCGYGYGRYAFDWFGEGFGGVGSGVVCGSTGWRDSDVYWGAAVVVGAVVAEEVHLGGATAIGGLGVEIQGVGSVLKQRRWTGGLVSSSRVPATSEGTVTVGSMDTIVGGDLSHGDGDGVCSAEALFSYGGARGDPCQGGWLPAGGGSRWLTATWIGGIAARVSLLLMLGFWAYYFVRVSLVCIGLATSWVGGPTIFIFYLFIKPGEGPSV